MPWGLFYDVPLPGDHDGDGDDDIAVYRPAQDLVDFCFIKDGPTVNWGDVRRRAGGAA